MPSEHYFAVTVIVSVVHITTLLSFHHDHLCTDQSLVNLVIIIRFNLKCVSV